MVVVPSQQLKVWWAESTSEEAVWPQSRSQEKPGGKAPWLQSAAECKGPGRGACAQRNAGSLFVADGSDGMRIQCF